VKDLFTVSDFAVTPPQRIGQDFLTKISNELQAEIGHHRSAVRVIRVILG
jgi:hypothetical protein